MEAILTGIASNLVAKALEVLTAESFKKAKSLLGAQEQGELEKVKQSIGIIKARVRDADTYQEAERLEVVKEWLLALKPVLYQADDLFDTIRTLPHLDPKRSKVRTFFSKSNPLLANRNLSKEIKSIRGQLDALKDIMAGLPAVNHPAQQLPRTTLTEVRETGTLVDPMNVVGREDDKEKIIDMLFDPKYDEEKITVIPIVGFGGLGKTTLAKLVFNDKRVQQHFELRRWAYVPEKDNLKVIPGKIYQAFKGDNYQDKPLTHVEKGIKDSIDKKKYLLVLDDVWIEEGANELLGLLSQGKEGSKVIVTTRSNEIAKHIGTIEVPYKLGTLSDDQSWTLFKKFAFGRHKVEDGPWLNTIGKEIVKMCGNVPLAIQVVGGSLCGNHTRSHWWSARDLLKGHSKENDKITAILKLSYDYLTLESKFCFAYCSLIPKGHEFEMDDLVPLWLAQGYVELDKGERHFSDLVARNLLQVSEVSNGDTKRYKMHDLLHDLAQKVAGNNSMVYQPSKEIQDQVVHLNLNGFESPPSLKEDNRLRSLLNFKFDFADDNFFSKFQSLRVLSMVHSGEYENFPNEYENFPNEYKKLPISLPSSIGRLIHLRYLKIKSNAIEYLPDSITKLVNLQTLSLQSCIRLKELPRDFARLVNLRHLLLPSQLTDLPPEFEKLKCLQELNLFKVGKNNGIDSLPALNLKGRLCIEFCSWREDAKREGGNASLENNYQMTSLHLAFEEEESICANGGEMNEVLSSLQLPPNLTDLSVFKYKGDEMPVRWLGGLSQLVSIKLYFCSKCKVVPRLSGLPHLKSLDLANLNELEYIEDGDEDEDEDNVRVVGTTTHNRCFFPSLQFLELSDCDKLKGWRKTSRDDGERHQLVFPNLLKMKVYTCPMLMSMPLAPKLESLVVCEINWNMLESNVRSNEDNEEAASSSSAPSSSSSLTLFTSLKDLRIYSVNDGLNSLSIGSSLCNLSVLRITNCSQPSNLRFESPNSIRELNIYICSRLKDISEGLQHLSRLEELQIKDCEELELVGEEAQRQVRACSSWEGLSNLRKLRLIGLPKVVTLPRGIGCLTTLQHLDVWKMENLTELPEEIGNLPSLRRLFIEKCPKVKSLPLSILGLPMLQELYIWKMQNLTEFSAGDIIGNGNVSCLEIRKCPKMKSLPESIKGFTSLQTVVIDKCPDLAKNYMPDGEKWEYIKHIPNLYMFK